MSALSSGGVDANASRASSGQTNGATLVEDGGNLTAQVLPAPTTQAVLTIAGVAGVAYILKSITAFDNDTTATVALQVLDGASIIWQTVFQPNFPTGVGGVPQLVLPCSMRITIGHALTVQFSSAPAGGFRQCIAIEYKFSQ